MKNLHRLNTIGLISFVVSLLLTLILSVIFELKYLAEGELLFYVIVVIANSGFLVFTAIGFVFWIYFFKYIG